jgi:beta-N-acetylhexosaminidase
MDDLTREEILDFQHEALLRQVSGEGITLLGGSGPDIPLQWERRRGLWVLPSGTEHRLRVDAGHVRELVEPLGMELLTVGLRPDESERDEALRRARGADYVVACTLSRGVLNAEQRQLVDALVTGGKRVILVSLLDPHDLADFPLVPTRLATYGFGPLVLDGLVDVLLGRVEANEGPPLV